MKSIDWPKISKVGTLIGLLLAIISILSAVIVLSRKHIPSSYSICAIGFEISLALIVFFNIIRKNTSGDTPDHRPETPIEKHRGLSVFELWSLVFSLLTIIISVLGFWYVVKGLDSSDKTYRTSTYLQTYGWTIEIDKAFTANPELRPYFYNNLTRDAKPSIDSNKLAATAELILDTYDAVLNNESYFVDNPIARTSWKSAMKEYFRNSPTLCNVYCKEMDNWPNIGRTLNN